MRKPGHVSTVTGEITSDQLGVTLAHEHLYCDVSVHSGKEDNVLTDIALIVQELEYFRRAGARSIVDVTPEGIGRNPLALKAISQASGVQVLSGISFYVESTYPSWLRTASVDQIADYLVSQIEDGTDGVQAALIGELTSHNEPQPDPAGYKLHELEVQVFQAAARAQRRAGVAITTHASLGRGGHAQLDVLEQAGADLSRVAIGHCDAHWHKDPQRDMQYYLPILERGAYCGFDLVGWQDLVPDEIRAQRIAALVERGYARQIVLGTDTCRRSHLHAYGGRGFDYVWTSFLPRLRALGVTTSQIQMMLVDAPRKLLGGT